MLLNVVLVYGLVAKVIGVLVRRPESVTIPMEQLHSSERDWSAERRSNHNLSPVPSLMVGWGIGCWITSLLSVLGASRERQVWGNALHSLATSFYRDASFIVFSCWLTRTLLEPDLALIPSASYTYWEKIERWFIKV